ncbi:type I toxin-antitoxin system toxin Ldr family protein [Salmonella enterica subsp. enterica]|nr:type I toxin-antitoxin system toxin Ldr family protein [Salmonella enterica subsp. enterica]
MTRLRSWAAWHDLAAPIIAGIIASVIVNRCLQ